MSAVAPTPQELIRFCHPSHFASWLPALQPGTIERLRGTPRLAGRLHRLMEAGLPLIPSGSPSGPLERLALRPAAEVAEAGRWMGALWHGRAIGRCIAADEIAALETAIGQEARRFALRHAATTDDPLQVAVPDPAIGTTALAARLVEDGQHCLARWLELVAPPFQALAALRLPLDRPAIPATLGGRTDRVVLRVAEAFADAG